MAWGWVHRMSFLRVVQSCLAEGLAESADVGRCNRGIPRLIHKRASLICFAAASSQELQDAKFMAPCGNFFAAHHFASQWGFDREVDLMRAISIPAGFVLLIAFGSWSSVAWHPAWRA